jgi:hypothetical protein
VGAVLLCAAPSGELAEAAATAVPHWPQKRAVADSVSPQLAQRRASGEPQLSQKRAALEFSW